jgi:putative acyl-CoA dehydrogenase
VPQSDAHLVLAQADEGLSCLCGPRRLPDGSRNEVYIQRLKDKLGNRSNASSEVEFADAWGVAVGEPGRGVPTIVEMATHTRLDCVLGSAALLRQAVVQAMHHASHRMAFGKILAGHDLMRHVLCDLALESEAATVLALRLARAFELSDDPLESAIRRIVTPAAKFWVCKRTVAAVGECMEVLGGNGYVEEGPLARLYREAPVNSIWEGSGNIMCLDVLRAMGRDADAFDALAGELRGAGGGRPSYDRALQDWLALCADTQAAPWHARRIAGMLALLMQCAMLIRHAPAHVADAFVESRLGLSSWTFGDGARAFSPQSAAAILTRAWQPAA